MLKAFDTLEPGWKIAIAISTIVLAPMFEEVFFRGLLQSMLRNYLRPWPAILLASTLFMMMHWGVWHTWPALFALSLVLGYNYERCGRLWPAILIHALNNATAIVDRLFR
jgi:membrane protease YdiL (CAAX protease family)